MAQGPDEVRLVEQAEFDEMRASGKYTLTEVGEVTASEACTSGAVDAACERAARQALREAAAARGANLVVLGAASVLQSAPPRYTIRGTAYSSRAR